MKLTACEIVAIIADAGLRADVAELAIALAETVSNITAGEAIDTAQLLVADNRIWLPEMIRSHYPQQGAFYDLINSVIEDTHDNDD